MFIHPFKNTHELYSGQTSSIFLHTNTPRVEAVPGSKKEMIPLSHGHSSQIVLSQILVTGTAILISKDVVEMNQDVFVDFVGVLTDVIEMVNNRSNILLRWTACQCLWNWRCHTRAFFMQSLIICMQMCC
ncbi:endosomal transport [Desmophyllum pertusum]|uniref:Endosomal transport n=1 Tax=Desmophyllum pertusum TaxID=174260 RepID=A0A9W9Z6V7_9CNID|nr:endosomal transport [Desmophyllum pertusum]